MLLTQVTHATWGKGVRCHAVLCDLGPMPWEVDVSQLTRVTPLPFRVVGREGAYEMLSSGHLVQHQTVY
jgi:hypothetical protein